MKKKFCILLLTGFLLFMIWAVPHHFFNRLFIKVQYKIYEVIHGHQNAKELLNEIGDYNGEIAVEVNNNHPFFTLEEIDAVYDEKGKILSYEFYADLDILGRCQSAVASVGTDLMPADDREPIESVKPSGWHTVILPAEEMEDGSIYLYNRCHILAFCLTGENNNEKNLVTGTRALNLAMKEYEVQIARYVQRTENHVLYRVTPVFEGLDALMSGILLEAYSLEDEGRGVSFCVYIYNVQPLLSGRVVIDYTDGSAEYFAK